MSDLLETLIEITRQARCEVMLLGKAAMAELESSIADKGAIPGYEPAEEPQRWCTLNGVPVLLSSTAAPTTVEVAYRGLDGDLCLGVVMARAAFDDLARELVERGFK